VQVVEHAAGAGDDPLGHALAAGVVVQRLLFAR
jgi:hypothetical protein